MRNHLYFLLTSFSTCLFVSRETQGYHRRTVVRFDIRILLFIVVLSNAALLSAQNAADIWAQYNTTTDIADMAEYGNLLIINTSGGLVFLNKSSGQVIKRLNTVNSALPCVELGSIAVDQEKGWAYIALKTTNLGANGFIRLDLTTDSITHFTKWVVPNLLSDDISVLKVDDEGQLWVGTKDKGIWVGVPGVSFSAIFLTAQGLPHNEIVDIDFETNGAAWVAMRNHVAKIENGVVTATYTSSNSPLPAGPSPGLNTIMVDGNTIWVGAANGLHRLTGGAWQTFNTSNTNFPTNYIVDITKGGNGNMYVGLILNSYFMEYDGNTFSPITCLYEAATGGAERIRRFIPDGNKLWIGCENGLFTWNEANGCQHYPISDFPLFDNAIKDICFKSDGGTFVVQEESVVKINGNTIMPLDIVTYLPYGPGYLPYLNLAEMVEGDNGVMWVALTFYSYGLARIDTTGGWLFLKCGSDLPFTSGTTTLRFHDHKLYLPTSTGLYILNTQNNTWQHFDQNNSPLWNYAANQIELDTEGNLWLAYSGFSPNDTIPVRLLKFDGVSWDSLIIPDAVSVLSFDFSADGAMWAATYNIDSFWLDSYKVQRYDGTNWEVLENISSIISDNAGFIIDLQCDTAGNIWIATDRGVYKTNASGDLLAFYSSCNSGLVNNYVKKVEVAPAANAVWFTTGNGVSVLQPATPVTSTHTPPSADYLHAWPNPVENWITVKGAFSDEREVQIFLTDMLGVCIWTTRIKGGAQFNQTLAVGSLPPGAYFLFAQSGSSCRVVRLIKQ